VVSSRRDDDAVYTWLFEVVLRRIPAELAHTAGFGLIRLMIGSPLLGPWFAARLGPRDPSLRVRAFGVTFPSPLGLAAGFDKDAKGAVALGRLGFGHVEVGTVTNLVQPGNPKPRLFRLPADRALLNRMGFNNSGARNVAARLHALPRHRPVVGVNIGKSKLVPTKDAAEDYCGTAALTGPYADYVVVNVSSPNTPGLRELQQVAQLEPILKAVRAKLDHVLPARHVPLLVKITADLAAEDVDAVADLVSRLGLDGVVATNTTTARDGLATPPETLEAIGPGGISGLPLNRPGLEIVRRLRARLGPGSVIVSVGGIATGEDAYQRIRAGATLVQGYTAFVYAGITWPNKINHELAALLRRDGFPTLAAAVGADALDC
jgi:dihydroorotate dehydrogenase